jgi:2-polyprenyl-3-methyl-5-hydroxy-6-metoxy-1,4-benzoquinol methylase
MAQDKRFQKHWYKHVAAFVRGYTVLDVGAGSGYGLDILREAGAVGVKGCDPFPLRPDVIKATHEGWPVDGFDFVTAIDVVEHVENDVGFLFQLLRIARLGVFLTTPNWNVTQCANAHHVREYTPGELVALVRGHPFYVWTSDAKCKITSGFDPVAANFGLLVLP